MHGVGIGGQNGLAAGAEILQRRQGDLSRLSAGFRQQSDRGLQRLDLLGVGRDVACIEMADDPNPQSLNVLPSIAV